MKKLFLLACTGLLLAGCNAQTTPSSQEMSTETSSPDVMQEPAGTPVATMAAPVTIPLSAQQNSGQSGTATFTDLGNGQTKVTLSLTGGKFTAAQPAHIHMGSCPKPGDVKYPLTDVVNGQSETTIDAPFSSLWSSDMAVNVHKSAKESTVYTACGNLSQTGTSATPSMMPSASTSPMLPSASPATLQGY